MKIAGQEVRGTIEDVLVLPRGKGEDLVIRGRAETDPQKFKEMVAVPEPPITQTASGNQPDFTNPGYIAQMNAYSQQRFGYLILNTLYECEFDILDIEDPKTWGKWDQEFTDAGFNEMDKTRIVNFVSTVNSLNERAVEAARENFLRSQEAQSQSG